MTNSNESRAVELRIPITLWLVLSMAVLVLSGLYWWASSSLEKTIIFFAAASTAAGTIAAALYAGRSLRANLQARRDELTLQMATKALSYGERWNNPTMFHMRKVCGTILRMKAEGKTNDEIEKYADSEAVSVAQIMNFLEELAIARQCGAADPILLRNQFEGIVLTLWHSLSRWIVLHRNKRQRPRIWSKVEDLYKEWCA